MTIIEICAIVAVLIFAILSGFIIRTLLPLQRSLNDVEKKLKNLNPLIESFTEDSDVKKLREQKRVYESKIDKEKEEIDKDHIGFDVVEWLLLTYKLGEKFIKRR